MNPGDLVSGRYLVVERLGAGGMGAVYRVEHSMMRVPMAMKVLRPELSTTEEMEKRFEREAKAAARLDSPHIVRANDFGRMPDGTLFLVMELIEGETLMKRIKRGRIEVDEALEILDQILVGLSHAHAHDVLHRDLKPGNVMLVGGGDRLMVKILDFGLAKLTTGDDSPLTKAGMVYGTARYMSPEQASCAAIDHRSDLYSAGVILYLLLTGRVPFEGSESEIMRAHLATPPPPLDELKLGDPAREAAIRDIVFTALAKSPDARFQDAESFRAALLECRSGAVPSFADATFVRGSEATFVREAPAAKPPAAASEPKARGRSRFKLAIAGCVALALALIGRSVFVSWSNAREVERLLTRGHEASERRAWDDALLAYEGALRLDPERIEDPQLSANAKRMLAADRTEGHRFLELISRVCDDSAAPLLAEVVQTAEDPKAERIAYEALHGLGELDRIDAVAVLVAGLDGTRASECEIRKWYVTRLGELGNDPRVLPALRKEQSKKAGFLFFRSDANGCMKQDLDRLIADLED